MSPSRVLARLFDGERRRASRRIRGYAPLDGARENELVRAVGVVRPLDETLVAPLSGRACVAYRSWFRESWIGLIFSPSETAQIRPFVLDLGGEEIRVDGDRALFGLAPLARSPRDRDRERSFFAQHALPYAPSSAVPTSGLFSELALELGARVVVGGTLVLVPRDEPPSEGELGFRDPPPPSRRIVGNRERPLLFAEPDGAE